MSADDYITEDEAAALIGWSTSNLRSHRLRLEAERIAGSLPDAHKTVIEAVRSCPWGVEPVLAVYEGPALFRQVEGKWTLTQMGLEVSRRLHAVLRRAPEPPRPAVVRRGRVRYRRDDVLAWLDAHPRISDREAREAETWDDRQTAQALGLTLGTLRTAISRAHVSRKLLDAGEPDPRGKLARRAAKVPPWTWAGSERRWIPAQVRAWQQRRREPTDDPLTVAECPERGPLLSEAEALSMMNVSAETLVGYRARARAALRRLGASAAMLLPRPPLPPQRAPSVGSYLHHRGAFVVMPTNSPPPIWAHFVADHQTRRDYQRARACPPYVLRDGHRWYHEQDVRAWLARRGAPRL